MPSGMSIDRSNSHLLSAVRNMQSWIMEPTHPHARNLAPHEIGGTWARLSKKSMYLVSSESPSLAAIMRLSRAEAANPPKRNDIAFGELMPAEKISKIEDLGGLKT